MHAMSTSAMTTVITFRAQTAPGPRRPGPAAAIAEALGNPEAGVFRWSPNGFNGHIITVSQYTQRATNAQARLPRPRPRPRRGRARAPRPVFYSQKFNAAECSAAAERPEREEPPAWEAHTAQISDTEVFLGPPLYHSCYRLISWLGRHQPATLRT